MTCEPERETANTLKSQSGKGGSGIGPEHTFVSFGGVRPELHPADAATPSIHTDPERDGVSDGAGLISQPSATSGFRGLLPDVAAPLSHGSNPNSNMAGRRREDDVNLVSFDAEFSNQGEPSEHAVLTRKLRRAASETTGVRRLTPTECERLQDWPDQWTNPTGDAPDSRRYAACGDGVTASVAEWIGRRLVAA